MPVAAAVLPRHDLRRRASRLAPNRTTTARASPLKATPDRRPSHRRGRYLPALRRVQQRLALRRRRVAPRPLRRIGDGLVLPALLVTAPVTVRFAFARARLADDGREPAYQLSSGRLWWRCLSLTASRGALHPCAERLAKHLSWHLDDRVSLINIRAVLGGYAAYHHLSLRTAWTDWGRLVAAGWLAPTCSPAHQGPNRPQGPGSGRVARYTLTVPAEVVARLRSRARRPVTSLVTSSSQEAIPSPSVPPRTRDHRRGWISLQSSTTTQRRNASALLAGCHEPWRRQRPNHDLLTRPDWQRLLPLIAQVQAQRPDVALSALLTDRVASARSLPGVLAWRLWRLLRASHSSENPSQHPATRTDHTRDEDTDDDQQHLQAVRVLGGPAAARAALKESQKSPGHERLTLT